MKKILLFSALIFSTALAFCQGSRIMLTQLERGPLIDGSRQGFVGMTNANGDQRYVYYVNVGDTCVTYTPTATGNSVVSIFVQKCGTDSIWYVDWEGRSILLAPYGSGGSGTADRDWLVIQNDSIPRSILDSIYTEKYAAVNMRYVWPEAQLLVGDSSALHSGNVVIAGNRNARVGWYRISDGSWTSLGQEGQSLQARLGGSTTDFEIAQSAGTSSTQPTGSPRVIVAVGTDSTIQFVDFPNTRRDTNTISNFLYTDDQGYLHSQSIDSIPGGGGNGIYGGSGTVPAFTTATLTGLMRFRAFQDTSAFKIDLNDAANVSHWGTSMVADSLDLYAGGLGGTSHIYQSPQAIRFRLSGAGHYYFYDQDARYAADYSAGYSTRSLVDKGYVDGKFVPAGSNTQIQYNNSGAFGATPSLSWVSSRLSIGSTGLDGYIRINRSSDGLEVGSISTGGGLFKIGSSQNQAITLNVNSVEGLRYGVNGNINFPLSGIVSTPIISATGNWYSGGSSTTTKPQVLIEPTGTTSTGWNTSGTAIGVNAATGFTGAFLDLQVNGVSKFNVIGGVATGSGFYSSGQVIAGNNRVIMEAGFTSSSNGAISTTSGKSLEILADETAGRGMIVQTGTGAVGIGTTTPNASSLLDISSTTKGFLQPRQTTTQRNAIASPAEGLEIANTTTNRPNYYNGSSWKELSFTDDIPTLASGTYKPTLTGVANVDSTSAYTGQYSRNGNTVTFSGLIHIDPTAGTGTVTTVGISLPVSSNFTALSQCAGTATALGTITTTPAVISADITNHRAEINFNSGGTTVLNFYFTFTYTVI